MTLPQKTEIDWNLIKSLEGWMNHVYVPQDKVGQVMGKSGPTIAMGFDIGQHSVADLEALNLPNLLLTRLAPYCGIKGQKAKNFVQAHPLILTEGELQELMSAIGKDFETKLEKEFEANSDLTYAFIPAAAKTVLASVAWQYGDLRWHCPAFFKYATRGMWASMVKELRNFGDNYTPRRLQEATYLENSIKKGN